jgi:hypothetical protein
MVARACCRRARLNRWLDADEAVRVLRSWEWPEPPRLSHWICDDCFEELTADRRPAAAVGAVA